jgi:polyisoprenoid-binding protein YceI
MKKKFALIFSFCSFAVLAHEVTVKVSLTPAGSFEARTVKLKGEIKKSDQKYSSELLWVKVEEFKTGIDLRDEHFIKHLNYEKYPKITLTNIIAENSKGTGVLNVNEVKKTVNFNYKMLSEKKLEATFKIKPSDFKLKEAKYLEIGVDDEVEIVAILDV